MFGKFASGSGEDDGGTVLGLGRPERPMMPAGRVSSVGGDMLQCVTARRNGGCGLSEHCGQCAIRRSVLYTRVTGDPQQNVVTYQDVMTAEGKVKHVRMVFDVWKFDDTVELRVQDILTLLREEPKSRMAQRDK